MHAFQQDASLSSNRLKTSFYSHLTGCHRTFVVFESISFLNNRKNRIKFTFCFYFYSVGKFPALIFNTSNINIAAFRITKSSYFISRYKRFVCQFDNNRKIFTRSSGCHLCYKQTNKNVRTHLLIKTLSEKKKRFKWSAFSHSNPSQHTLVFVFVFEYSLSMKKIYVVCDMRASLVRLSSHTALHMVCVCSLILSHRIFSAKASFCSFGARFCNTVCREHMKLGDIYYSFPLSMPSRSVTVASNIFCRRSLTA